MSHIICSCACGRKLMLRNQAYEMEGGPGPVNRCAEATPWLATVTAKGIDAELRTFARRCDAKRWCEMLTASDACG